MPPSETSKIRDYLWAWVREGRGLDIGCGPDKVHPECVGLDQLDKPGIVNGSAEALPFAEDEFDWVYSSHCVEHLDNPKKAIAEMIRVLKPDGTLLLYLPYKDWYDKPLNYPSWHKHHFRPNDILDMVREYWPDMWIVTEELRGKERVDDNQEYGFLLILKRIEPSNPKKFYIKNWPQLGDTYSLDRFIRWLPTKYPGCEVHLQQLRCDLYPDLSYVHQTPDPAGVQWDGIMGIVSGYGQYHNYIRREKHFYTTPFWFAYTKGWVTLDDIPEDIKPTPLVFTDEEEQWAAENCPDKPFVLLAHHAGFFPRDWNDGRWKRVVEWLISHDFDVVSIGTRSVGFAMPGFIDLTNKTTIRQAACLAKRACCAVGVDTGMFHVLPSLDIPSLVLSGPSRFDATFMPPARALYRNDAGCQQCYGVVPKDWFSEGEHTWPHSRCDAKHTACMEAISVGRVIDALADMLCVSDNNQGLISVVMIVHNEEQHLREVLDPVHEHVDEIIIVDTGSTDRTKEIAQTYKNAKVFDYDAGNPIRSFSEARNYSISMATSRYIMWLDGSHTVYNMPQIINDIRDHNYDVIQLATKSGDTQHMRNHVCLRVFAKFHDRVHETMGVDGLRSLTSSAYVTRRWHPKVGREDSLARNVRLLKMMIDESGPSHPNYPRWLYYVGRELVQMGNTDEGLAYHRKRVEVDGFWEERGHSALAIVHVLKGRGRFVDAVVAAYDALKHCDGWRDAYYLIADCYYNLKKYDKAIAWLKHTLEIPVPYVTLWKWESVYTFLPYLLMSMCYEAKGDKSAALHWLEKEREVAPADQQARITARRTTLMQR